MADYWIFLILSFLFHYYSPLISTSSCDSLKGAGVEWNKVPPDTVQLFINDCNVSSDVYESRHLPKLNLTSSCIKTLTSDVFGDLKKKCLKEVQKSFSNYSRLQGITSVCTCEFISHSTKPLNSTACAEMLKNCGSSSVGMALGISFLVIMVICGVACVWHWKRGDTTQINIPRFLQRRSSRRKNYGKTLLRSHITGSNPKISVDTKGHKAVIKEIKMHSNYENVEAGPHQAREQTDKELYENTKQFHLQEHIYGNETSSHYYNFQKPDASVAAPDEDIYILPDAS